MFAFTDYDLIKLQVYCVIPLHVHIIVCLEYCISLRSAKDLRGLATRMG
jgi:hypothetical protein